MISCSICYENFEQDTDNEPKIMECGDTFCLKCIQSIKKEKEKFLCPICQKEIYEKIEDMPTNKYVFDQLKNILCDMCSNEFDNNYKSNKAPRVLNCGHSFCTNCLKSNLGSGEVIRCMSVVKKQKEKLKNVG